MALDSAVPRADPNTRRIQLDLPGQLEYDMVGYRIAPGSAVLRGDALPGRVRLAMVVRDGRVLVSLNSRRLGIDHVADTHLIAKRKRRFFRSHPEVFKQVVDLFDPTAEEQGVGLQLCGDEAVCITGDRDLLFDAISNLVDNAIKHGREEVTVAVLRGPGGPVLTVADRGPGIPIEERKRAFALFSEDMT